MNTRSMLLGGLVAGAVYNASGMVLAGIADLGATFTRMGVEPTLGGVFMHLGLRFMFGLVSVFLYAAVRPRFGPGARAALVVGLVMWLTAYVPGIVLFQELNVFTGWQAGLGMMWGLPEACVATLVGARLYREG